ncbi:Fe-S cluster assembly protein SufB [Candidatus Dojkabacteria bacterium]|nr:Fe-S cluster assembly protein SufB [Candidatus Dojkabacteria bacterium]
MASKNKPAIGGKTEYKEKYGFSDHIKYAKKFPKGINEDVVRQISALKNEPKWMLDIRLRAYKEFISRPMPKWGADLSQIDFDNIHYYAQASEGAKNDWEDVPEKIKRTFDKLQIPQSERKFLAGTATQYESEVVYSNLKKQWSDLGIVFEDTDTGLREHPEIFKKYFGKLIPYKDNKFAALNTAVWSGGSFIYIPKGVKLDMPLQTYFRINLANMGQFERTLIIAEERSSISYIEGCSAPMYSRDSLHAAVVEIFVLPGAKVRYTTIQNWSDNVYNLVTKRAAAYKDSRMEWIDCNLGSKVTMKYPAVWLKGAGAHGEVLSIAYADKGQVLDAGAKIVHHAPHTSSLINSKSICLNGGRTSYRGLLKATEKAANSKSKVICDALIFDDQSRTDTYPTNEIDNPSFSLEHEASVSKVSTEQLEYLMSRGLSEEDASALIVSGFLEPVAKELPIEYAVELNALINMSMEDSVG